MKARAIIRKFRLRQYKREQASRKTRKHEQIRKREQGEISAMKMKTRTGKPKKSIEKKLRERKREEK